MVGMAGRFPGAGDVAELWRNLVGGVESISFFSKDELRAAGVPEQVIDDPNYVPARPVLDDITGFDAAFFGISPRMAALTDPQQRLFLEVCWEGLEQAGYAAPEYRGRVGVYGGTNLSTYLLQMPEGSVTGGDVSTYEIIMGNEKDALTTTVSYLFDLAGPSVAVQTFCSTSLVATHLAVQALRNGECEMALAGGVSIRVPDRVGHIFGPGGQESPDGHVRTFDAQARGSMFGDGAAVVVLKRLSDALRDGDHIWSVIRGSAMNNDGALKVGYTAPSVVGQAQVVVDAMADARVTGDEIGYIEAHGTATELGDPIEVAALVRAFGETAERQYCPIGSVKTNIGHLDRAAGVTGLIKASLALHEEQIPATLHYTSPNPALDIENSPFYVNAELSPWPRRADRPRIAGINSLGMGGTNVHVVVEQAPERQAVQPDDRPRRRYQVLPVSARTETAAAESCQRLAGHLTSADYRLSDVAFTLQAGRKTFEHRRVTVAETPQQAAAALSGSTEGALLSRVDTVRGRPLALLFAGTGEQYPGLVTELYQREPDFRAALDECLALLKPLLPGRDLRDLLTGGRVAAAGLAALLGRDTGEQDPRSAALAGTELVQPALFAVEYALARTLLGWGLQPRVLAGYSLGEYVAATLAGVLSLSDAIALVAYRARLIATLPAGSMLAVSLPVDELRSRFLNTETELDVAAVNGPQVTVVAGPVPVVQRFTERLRAAEIGCRPLATTHAFHSRMLKPVADELTEWVGEHITLNPPQLPYLSNVTGGYADAALVCDPGYWARHMCEPVQFAAIGQALLADVQQVVLEVGPGQSLGALLRTAGASPQQWPLILAALPGGSDSRPDDAALTDSLARLWLLGVELNWPAYHGRGSGSAIDPAELPGRVPLPSYPFQRQRYWIEGGRPTGRPATDLAGVLELPEGEVTLEHIAALPTLPPEQWLYLPVWRQAATPVVDAQQPAHWLVYTQDGVAEQVLSGLRPVIDGAGLVLVRPGEAFAATEDGFTIRPGSLPDTVALLRELRATGVELDRVLHLWALEPAPDETIVTAGLHTLVALARAAGEFGMDAWSLDVVVSGSQQVLDDDVAHPTAATLLGPVRVIPLEYPSISTRLVDLDPAPGTKALTALLSELRGPRADSLVALRHGRRWLPEYEQLPAAEVASDELPGAELLRQGGVYLITGGLGGIALGLAERMARDCKAKLVLLARTGLPERDRWDQLLATPDALSERDRERIGKVRTLLELGAEVEIVTGDVSDPEDVRRAYETALERFGGLHGVLHAAGVPAIGLMQFKQPAELDQVLAPKVAGTLALLDALRVGKPEEHPLDFLVIFSSITSITGGGPGQVDYCAANAYCDSIAAQLATEGRRVLAVDWGEWAWNAWEEGLAGYTEELQEFFRANRARIGIDFERGWHSLLRALATGESRVVVNTLDFGLMARHASKFNLASVTGQGGAEDAEGRHPRPELVTPYQEPAGEIELAVAEIWCDALRLERLGVLDNYFELGGNSLLGVSIVAALRKQFISVELAPHVLYEAPTVAALGELISGQLSGEARDDDGADSQVRAQLRRSGLQASATRRRGR
ncbi:MAG TPA: SDR family oxidoreductase [Jatrophihabitans sp.]|nr:SDR family oxidoreductase [Jatrophihabitans sp.]